jgi:hypothetical protein
MGYVPQPTLDYFKSAYNLGVFFRLGTDPALHLSFLTGDMKIRMSTTLDDAGTVYFGCGRLQNIPDLMVLTNGIADTYTFTLNGLDPTMTARMLDSAPEVLGARLTVGIAPLTDRWQPATSIVQIWTGVADFLSESMPPETDPLKNRTQSLSLVAMSGDQSRQRQDLATYSDAAQRARSPTDSFCSRTNRAPYQVVWPRNI